MCSADTRPPYIGANYQRSERSSVKYQRNPRRIRQNGQMLRRPMKGRVVPVPQSDIVRFAMPRRTRKKNRRLLVPSHPDLSRTVIEPLVFIFALAAFLALVIVILTLVT
jgi:hypothetical protein